VAAMKLKVAVGILVLIILALTVFGDHGLLNLVRYRNQREALTAEANQLEAENCRLQDEIERLKGDDLFLERVAREELGMVKPGEIIFQFTETKGSPPKTP
jgi:cell division protein FtsB